MSGLHRSTLFERQESPVDIRQVGITYYSNIPYINVPYHIWRYLQHTQHSKGLMQTKLRQFALLLLTSALAGLRNEDIPVIRLC
jgi:hypothetical protein